MIRFTVKRQPRDVFTVAGDPESTQTVGAISAFHCASTLSSSPTARYRRDHLARPRERSQEARRDAEPRLGNAHLHAGDGGPVERGFEGAEARPCALSDSPTRRSTACNAQNLWSSAA